MLRDASFRPLQKHEVLSGHTASSGAYEDNDHGHDLSEIASDDEREDEDEYGQRPVHACDVLDRAVPRLRSMQIRGRVRKGRRRSQACLASVSPGSS